MDCILIVLILRYFLQSSLFATELVGQLLLLLLIRLRELSLVNSLLTKRSLLERVLVQNGIC